MDNRTKFFILLALLFVGMKFIYTKLTVDELAFILAPVHLIVELVTGTNGTFVPGQGYLFSSLNIVIDRSCSGFNLWIISFVVIGFLAIKHGLTNSHRLLGILGAIGGSLVFTIAVNSARILLLIKLGDLAQIAWLHEGVGVLINLTFLILIYILLTKKITHEKLV